MKKHSFLLFIFVLSILPLNLNAQNSQVRILRLEDVITLANENSLEALLAKHRFTGSYWSYRSYKANYLPSVSLEADLIDLNRSIVKDQVLENGEWVPVFGQTQNLNSSVNMQVTQMIPLPEGEYL